VKKLYGFEVTAENKKDEACVLESWVTKAGCKPCPPVASQDFPELSIFSALLGSVWSSFAILHLCHAKLCSNSSCCSVKIPFLPSDVSVCFMILLYFSSLPRSVLEKQYQKEKKKKRKKEAEIRKLTFSANSSISTHLRTHDDYSLLLHCCYLQCCYSTSDTYLSMKHGVTMLPGKGLIFFNNFRYPQYPGFFRLSHN